MEEGTCRILKLCLVTSARVGEVAGMTAEELDLEHQVWTIPPSRSKNARQHVLPLSDLAVEIIKKQLAEVRQAAAQRHHRLTRQMARRVGPLTETGGAQSPEYVFPGPGVARADHGVWGRRRYRSQPPHFGIEPFVSHDLRRTAATEMETIGVSPFIVAHVLGHVSVTKASITSKVYARYDYAREKREAIEQMGRAPAGNYRGGRGGGAFFRSGTGMIPALPAVSWGGP